MPAVKKKNEATANQKVEEEPGACLQMKTGEARTRVANGVLSEVANVLP